MARALMSTSSGDVSCGRRRGPNSSKSSTSSGRTYRWIHSASHQPNRHRNPTALRGLTAFARPVSLYDEAIHVPGSQSRNWNPETGSLSYGFGGAGIGAELAISHLPPCLTIVLT